MDCLACELRLAFVPGTARWGTPWALDDWARIATGATRADTEGLRRNKRSGVQGADAITAVRVSDTGQRANSQCRVKPGERRAGRATYSIRGLAN